MRASDQIGWLARLRLRVPQRHPPAKRLEEDVASLNDGAWIAQAQVALADPLAENFRGARQHANDPGCLLLLPLRLNPFERRAFLLGFLDRGLRDFL
jgi:hypothetical protein